MSNEYRLVLLDEFDWAYAGFDLNALDEQVKKVCPDAVRETHIPYMVVYDISKTDPERFLGKVTCDHMYYQINNSPVLLEVRRTLLKEE